MSTFYIKRKNEDICHYGVLGMKWGVRRYQNEDGSLTAAGKKRYELEDKTKQKQIDRIDLMYTRANKWTNRKIEKLDTKGKNAKADVMRVMANKNEQARIEKINNISKMNLKQELRTSKKMDLQDAIFGGQMWMENNKANMTTVISRFNEYNTQRGMRWMSNFTLNSTLSRMSPEEGYDYLKRKQLTLASASGATNTQYVN